MACAQLTVHNKDVYCVNVSDAAIWKWDYGVPLSWQRIGENCDQLAIIDAKGALISKSKDRTDL